MIPRQELTSIGGGMRAGYGDRLRLELLVAAPLDRTFFQPDRDAAHPALDHHPLVAMELPMKPAQSRRRARAVAVCSSGSAAAPWPRRRCSRHRRARRPITPHPTVVSGNAGITNGPGTSTITVNTPQAIIDWRSISVRDQSLHLPSERQCRDLSRTALDNANFAVLNRILASRADRASTAGW